MCSSLTNKIVTQNPYLDDSLQQVRSAKKRVQAEARATAVMEAAALSTSLSLQTERMLELASEKRCKPLRRHSFALTKSEFRDGFCLRYGWCPDRLPSFCPCGAGFSVGHAPSCPTGGFPSVRHNEVRDVTAHLLKKVTHNVAIEPTLQPVTGERGSSIVPPTVMPRLDLMFQQTAFGVAGFNALSLLSGSSTLMRLLTAPVPLQLRMSSTKKKNADHMNNDSVR